MSNRPDPDSENLSIEALERIDRICIDFEAALIRGEEPLIEDYLGTTEGSERARLLEELALLAADYRKRRDRSSIGGRQFCDGTGLDEETFAANGRAPELIGKYRIVASLDEGGQAKVYRAIHPTLEKELVIKLAREPLSEGFGVERLLAEGRVLAEIDHPNIARVYDLDVHEGRPFLVMEFIRGRNLAQFAEGKRPSPSEAAAIVAKVARALHTAHVRGVVHKDVKPHNIVMDSAGEPRVIDFALARLRSAWTTDRRPTLFIEGTICCMPPEQARGEEERVNERSDIFGLGTVLYWMLTGTYPFTGKDENESLGRARRCEFDRTALESPGIPSRLRRICLKAMAADPADRHCTAEALTAELDAFHRNRLSIRLLGVFGLVLMALLLVFAIGAREDSNPQNEPAHGIMVSVSRGGVLLNGFEEALPLRTEDSISLKWRIPPGFEPSLFWLDTDGKVHVQKMALMTETQDAREFGYPHISGKLVSIVGEPGTEVVFLCARRGSAPSSDDIVEAVAEDTPWPHLPEKMLVHFDSERVWSQMCDTTRGPGTLIDAPQGVIGKAEALRRRLAARCTFVRGIAFPHVP